MGNKKPRRKFVNPPLLPTVVLLKIIGDCLKDLTVRLDSDVMVGKLVEDAI